MSTQGTRASATTLVIAGSAIPPDTSLTRTAPASSAAAATDALVVSTEQSMPSAASAAITGTTRSRSVPASMRWAPGRVDSPPTSTMTAPSATSCRPRAIAASVSSQRPPSENESGVTLTTPMIHGRAAKTGTSMDVIVR